MAGSALGGFGFSLVFPAIGVEAVKRVPENNRGTALGVYTAFADVSFFLTGPLAGAVIGVYGYASVFLFALFSVCLLSESSSSCARCRATGPDITAREAEFANQDAGGAANRPV